MEVGVVGVEGFEALEAAHGVDGDGEHKNLVDSLQQGLGYNQAYYDAPGENAAESNRKEYQRVKALSHYRTYDGSRREAVAAGGEFHAAHHPGIGQRAGHERHE